MAKATEAQKKKYQKLSDDIYNAQVKIFNESAKVERNLPFQAACTVVEETAPHLIAEYKKAVNKRFDFEREIVNIGRGYMSGRLLILN